MPNSINRNLFNIKTPSLGMSGFGVPVFIYLPLPFNYLYRILRRCCLYPTTISNISTRHRRSDWAVLLR